MMLKEEIDYKLAAEQLRTGKPLFGKEGRDCKQGISVCQNPNESRRHPEELARISSPHLRMTGHSFRVLAANGGLYRRSSRPTVTERRRLQRL